MASVIGVAPSSAQANDKDTHSQLGELCVIADWLK